MFSVGEMADDIIAVSLLRFRCRGIVFDLNSSMTGTAAQQEKPMVSIIAIPTSVKLSIFLSCRCSDDTKIGMLLP